MSAYFDHNATTPVDERVVEAMLPYFRGRYGNPSSLHRLGRLSRQAVEQARDQVAGLVGAHPGQVIFTSGGTEANNLALRGPNVGRLVVSAVEHASVMMPARFLESTGCELFVAGVDPQGRLDRVLLEAYLHDAGARPSAGSGLVSVMLANNETGALQDISSIAALAREHGYLVHSDAAQSAGRIPVRWEALGIHMMTLSAHKMYGPKGVGALIVDKAIELTPQMLGGGHESGFRAGTENLASIVGFGAAAELARGLVERRSEHLKELRSRLEHQIASLPVVTYSADAERLPNTVCFSVPGIDGETLVMQLDRAGFAVSSGSACDSGGRTPSHVLMAMGVSAELAGCAIRISLGVDNTIDDVDAFVVALAGLIDRFTPRQAARTVATVS
ncbi:MAG: aminotransferase class V-fold PLP-dependent enzyme [Gammaproteobacteria bacterium]|nr:aminotransferase class V-fold PLP-dependent enzyme [Gammaproteobacteria bacterium]